MEITKGKAYYEFNPISAISPNGQFTIKIGEVGLPIGLLPVPLGGINGKGKQETNAKLISEAFNVANETGFSPRELAEQKAELLDIINSFVISDNDNIEFHNINQTALDSVHEKLKKYL